MYKLAMKKIVRAISMTGHYRQSYAIKSLIICERLDTTRRKSAINNFFIVLTYFAVIQY